jgi:hypothetical protein
MRRFRLVIVGLLMVFGLGLTAESVLASGNNSLAASHSVISKSKKGKKGYYSKKKNSKRKKGYGVKANKNSKKKYAKSKKGKSKYGNKAPFRFF